ncbi:MAG: DUF1194 domain-containing protein [Rhodospirillaceae bacterium]
MAERPCRATRSRLAAALCGLILATCPGGGGAKEAVDLELVIATDVSFSIDQAEATLQREGIAQAFRSEEVIRAITSGVLGRIGVAYIDYSSRAFHRIVVDWRVIGDRVSAEAFAETLQDAPLSRGMHTSISDAVEHAAEMIESNDLEGTRRVIDVSGDGPNNFGKYVDEVRDATIARRIAINGLPILNPNDAWNSRYYLADLDLYFRGCVIGGPGAFMVVANSFADYGRAIRRKLILEIAGRMPAPARDDGPTLFRAASRESVRPSPSGYTYPRGCDIGERMRGDF